MKSFFNGLICLTLLSFAVACGKKSGGGGGSAAYVPLYNSGLTQNSQQVLANVTNWYNGAVEGYAPGTIVNIKKTEYTMNTAPTCTEKKFLGIPYNYCTYNGGSTKTNEVLSPNINILSTQGQAINAKGNAELNNIFNGASGTLMDAIESGSVAQLTFLRGDGVVVTYLIDRNIHSHLNPKQKIEVNNSQRKDTITTTY